MRTYLPRLPGFESQHERHFGNIVLHRVLLPSKIIKPILSFKFTKYILCWNKKNPIINESMLHYNVKLSASSSWPVLLQTSPQYSYHLPLIMSPLPNLNSCSIRKEMKWNVLLTFSKCLPLWILQTVWQLR